MRSKTVIIVIGMKDDCSPKAVRRAKEKTERGDISEGGGGGDHRDLSDGIMDDMSSLDCCSIISRNDSD